MEPPAASTTEPTKGGSAGDGRSGSRDRPYHVQMLMRVVSAVVIGIAGLVFGMLGTVVHSATIGPARLPWGIVVALAALACLLTGIRLLNDGRLYPACAALGALVAIGVLSQESFGGSVLITNGAVGWAWMGGALVIALVTVAWPRSLARARASRTRSS
jgi:hypothetical protein